MEIIKRVVSILVIGALLFFLIIYMQKSCAMERENIRLKKQYDIARKEVEAKQESYLQLRECSSKRISELNEGIAIATEEVTILKGLNEGRDKRIKELEKGYHKLTDKDEKITNLQAQIKEWKAKFSLAQDTIKEKDKIIFSLTEKYEQQSKLTYECEGLLSKETELRLLAEERIKTLHKSIVASHFGGKVKTVLIGGLIFAVIYSVVK